MGKIAIKDIVVGDRLREEHGDVEGLAKSMQQHGLIHPIVLDADRNLVAGGRRLRAAQSLGWEEIEYRDHGALTERERLLIEVEENARRKDLTSYEADKAKKQLYDALRQARKEEAELRGDSPRNSGADFRVDSARKSNGRGRPAEPGSQRDLSELTGDSPKTIREIEQRVEAAERFAFLQGPGWPRYQSLEAERNLKELPEEELPAIIAMMTAPYISPQDALKRLRNLLLMRSEERIRTLALYQNGDANEQYMAEAKAVGRSHLPNTLAMHVGSAVDMLSTAISTCPRDPSIPKLREIRREIQSILKEIDATHQQRVAQLNAESGGSNGSH